MTDRKFKNAAAARAAMEADGMVTFTAKELEDKALAALDEYEGAKLVEWFIACEGVKMLLVVLYRLGRGRGVYVLTKEIWKV